MRGIGFTADITNDAPTAPAALAYLVHCDTKTVARRHTAADDWRTIRAHDHAVIRPASCGEIERTGANVSLELGRAAHVRETERFRIDGPTSNENGQATSCPAVS